MYFITRKVSNTFPVQTIWKRVQSQMAGKSLQEVVTILENFAPVKNAEDWDNVGLLLEPTTPKQIQTIFLTNDLTEVVLDEAIDKKTDMIISYHPPIFTGLKRIGTKSWKERIVAKCLENRVALYSPHTAWDFANNGVGDWLASTLPYARSVPIHMAPDSSGGIGRKLVLKEKTTLRTAIDSIKLAIKRDKILLALGTHSHLDSIVKTAAICPGSGGSVLKDVEADLYLTGEMSHHQVLDATQRNISVVICNHSNSERGFLKHFQGMLENLLQSDVSILVSEKDSDPLEVY